MITIKKLFFIVWIKYLCSCFTIFYFEAKFPMDAMKKWRIRGLPAQFRRGWDQCPYKRQTSVCCPA